jgi:hypothetical protein
VSGSRLASDLDRSLAAIVDLAGEQLQQRR